MLNIFIIWQLASLMVSVCMAMITEPNCAIYIKQEGEEPFQMEVSSDWTAGQVVQKAIEHRQLVGLWTLRVGVETLPEGTLLSEAGIGADFQVELVRQNWDIASMEEKEPIFRVLLQGPILEEKGFFLQYVRETEGGRGKVWRDESSGRSFRCSHFRIVINVVDGGELLEFDPSNVPVDYETAKLLPALSDRQEWMAYCGSRSLTTILMPVEEIPGGVEDGPVPPDTRFIFGHNKRRMKHGSELEFIEVVGDSTMTECLRKTEREDFFKAGSEVKDEAALNDLLAAMEVEVTKTEPMSGRRAVSRRLRCMLPKCPCLGGQEAD